MSPRDRSSVRTSSPRHPSGKDPWNQWTTYTLTLLQLEQTTDSSGRRGTGPPTEPGFSQGFFSILSPMEFSFLAAVASGLLSWGHFIWMHIMFSVSDAEKLVHAFMTSRLDYCNALLGGCPASSINKLQIVQNAAARVLTRSRKYDHITPILQSLHWLPIKFRISYKILLLAYKALNDLAPAYLTNLLSRYNPTRSLRSQNSGLLVVPRIAKSIKGGRTFSYLAPKLWNSLPDNVRGSDTLSLFKSRLKTHLFSQAFI